MNRDKLDFGSEKIGKLFRAMFFPTLVAMAFNSVLNLCDGMFVGHGVGSDALAAINIVAPIFLVCMGIGLMFGIGASVIGGIRLSENNDKAARIIITQALIVGVIVFILITMVCWLFSDQVLNILGCSPLLKPYASDYLLWLLPGFPFLYMECAGMMLIRLDGSPKCAMAIQVFAASTNILLDWLFVYPLNMGIGGAAIATSISCAVSGIPVLLYFAFFSTKLRFYKLKRTWKSFRLTIRNTGYIIKIGFATFIAEMSLGVMMVVGNYMFMRYLGETGVAAYSIGCYLFPIIFSISNAVAQSAQPLISYNYGSRQFVRVRETLKIAISTGIMCGVIITGVMIFGSSLLTSIFLPPSAPAYVISANGLPLLGTCAVFFSLNITFIGYYQSIEASLRSTIYMFFRGIIFLVPCFLIIPELLGESGLWLAIPGAEFLTFIVIVACYVIQHNKVTLLFRAS